MIFGNIKLLKININIIAGIVVLYGAINIFKSYSKSINSNNVPLVCGLILLAFMIVGHLSIFIHELGHAIALRVLGFKIKIFKVGPIKYINNGKGRKVAFDKLGLFIIGGYVTPEVNEVVYDQKSFDKFTGQYTKFILSGIAVTIVLMVTATILLILNKAAIVSFLIIVVNWPAIIKSLDNENLSYGDFYLIKLLKDKPEYICSLLQNNLMIEYPLNPFLVAKSETFLKDSINKEEYNPLILGLADKILDEYIIQEKELSCELERLKEWVFSSYESAKREGLVSIITKIKISHKFLLHQYSLKMKSDFIHNYIRMLDYISKKEDLLNHELVKRIMGTLKVLYEDGNILDAEFKYIISDLEFSASECDNYRKKVQLIVDKL